jgi:hypothetical protein
MAIHIEQDKNQAKLAFSLQSRAEIDTIRLTESTVACKVAPENVSFPLVMMLKHQAEDAVVSGGKLTIPIRFGFKALTEDNKAEVLIITCRLEVAYELAEGYEPSPEQVEAFRQGNAIFNCWTYFREYVQNSVARMSFPPVTIPFLRMVPKAISATSAEGSNAVEDTPARVEPATEQRIGEPQKRRRRKKTEPS